MNSILNIFTVLFKNDTIILNKGIPSNNLNCDIYLDLETYNVYKKCGCSWDILMNLYNLRNDIGDVKIWLSENTPIGWVKLDGSTLNKSDNVKLYDLFGDKFTTNPNNLTFDIPNFNGKTLIGSNIQYPLGVTVGENETLLTIDNLPAHNHDFNTFSGSGNTQSSVNTVLADHSAFDYDLSTNNPNSKLNDLTISNTGLNEPVNNLQESVPVNYIMFVGV